MKFSVSKNAARSKQLFQQNNVNKVTYGTETISQLTPSIWDATPSEYKEFKTFNTFKQKIGKLLYGHIVCVIHIPFV